MSYKYNPFISNLDFYNNSNTIKVLTTQFDKTNSASLSNVTQLSMSVSAGKTYMFEAILHTTVDNIGGLAWNISGTCTATYVMYESILFSNDAQTTVYCRRETVLGGAADNFSTGTEFLINIKGTIIVNTAGTLVPQFAEQSAIPATTASILIGSIFTIIEII